MRALALSTERARALGPDFDPAVFEPARVPRRRPGTANASSVPAAIAPPIAAVPAARNGRFKDSGIEIRPSARARSVESASARMRQNAPTQRTSPSSQAWNASSCSGDKGPRSIRAAQSAASVFNLVSGLSRHRA